MTMRPRFAALAALVLLAAQPALASGVNPNAAQAPLTPAQEEAIESLVARWISENPGALRRALDPVRAAGVEEEGDGTLGNPRGDVAVVAFLDRGTAASVASLPLLAALAATDPGVRVVLKELPLVSRDSVSAALIAYAARAQGDTAFRGFEAALMAKPGPADAVKARAAAEQAGLDLAALDAKAAEPSAKAYLRRVRALSEELGINAVPTFLVGGRALVGAKSIDELREAVRAARGSK